MVALTVPPDGSALESPFNITLVVVLGCCNTILTSPVQVCEKLLITTLVTVTPEVGNPDTTRFAGDGVAVPGPDGIVIGAGLVKVVGPPAPLTVSSFGSPAH